MDLLDEFMTAAAETHSGNTNSAHTQTSCTPEQASTTSSQQTTHRPLDGSHVRPVLDVASAACNAQPYQATLVDQHHSTPSQEDNIPPATPDQHRIPRVPLVHQDNLSYQQFVDNFMQPNLPVMIQVW